MSPAHETVRGERERTRTWRGLLKAHKHVCSLAALRQQLLVLLLFCAAVTVTAGTESSALVARASFRTSPPSSNRSYTSEKKPTEADRLTRPQTAGPASHPAWCGVDPRALSGVRWGISGRPAGWSGQRVLSASAGTQSGSPGPFSEGGRSNRELSGSSGHYS